MTEVSRSDLAEILQRVLPDEAPGVKSAGSSEPNSSSVQCLGLEVTVGSVSATNVQLANPKLEKQEKRNLADLARDLLNDSEAASTLRRRGQIEIENREEGEATSEQAPHTRFIYAQEKTILWDEALELTPFRLRAWVFASERPSTPFSPLRLRTVFDRLESTVQARFMAPSRASFTIALRGGAFEEGLHVLAKLYPSLSAMVLWLYDEVDGRYRSLATYGTGRPFDVPIRRTHRDQHRGLVSQIAPDRRLVIYDAENRSLWQPTIEGDWQPFDTAYFKNRKWRSCIAIPIVSGGRLVGALTAYSRLSATVFRDLQDDLARDAAVCAEGILNRRDQEVIANLSARYDEELLTANVSLSALSLSHDVMHYFRAVNKFLEQAQGHLATRHLSEVKESLDEIEGTMARTKPAIASMLRLATEARTPRSGPQITSDPAAVLGELEALLRSVLPHVTRTERLKPDAIEAITSGTPRSIKVSEMTLERIIMNLCVNAAQWKATHVWVIGYFDRSKTQFHLVVRDDGKGIPASVRDHVFDRFFSARQGGSGLGLYVVKSLATQAGGEVHLQSYHHTDKVDQTGTAVTVVLPTVDQDPSA
jgi:signal transduction histidine kinase